jgi:two-component system, cell cycle sensor histidine kinase and response regulator CckA
MNQSIESAWCLPGNNPASPDSNLEADWRQAQKMEALGRLASGVAHDFNNLLTVIGGYAQILLDRSSHDSEMRDELMHILKASERAGAFTRQLLNFSSRHAADRLESIDLNALLTEQARLLRPLLGEDIELRTSLAPNLPPIEGNAGNLFQILLNVAANARDAMPAGGTLTFETALKTAAGDAEAAAVGSDKDTGPATVLSGPPPMAGCLSLPTVGAPARLGTLWVVLTCTDTGHGIDPAVKTHLFEPYFTTNSTGHGTGLGLAIVADLVRQMGGRIQVESNPGCGATFAFWFRPIDQIPALHFIHDQAAALLRGQGETILLVEDADFVRDLVHRVLVTNGYTVLTASNGADAIKLASVRPVDLLIADVVMPHMGGTALADLLKAANPRLRVLLVSGYLNSAAERGKTTQGHGFLQKPFSPDALLAVVRETLLAKDGSLDKMPIR